MGQRIKQGEKIGAMGNSGRSTGTHLHYEIKVAGEFVNPMAFIRAASDPASFDVVAAISNATAFAAPNDLDASPRPKSRP